MPTFDDVYREHAPQVMRWVSRLAGPHADVDDLVQEVFTVVSRRLDEFRGEAKMTTWLFRITDNTLRNWRRKQRIREIFLRQVDGPPRSSLRPTPLEEMEQRQAAERFYGVLESLNPRYQQVLVLFELEDMSTEEIAHLLEAEVGTVRVWLHRARAQFAKRFQEMEERVS